MEGKACLSLHYTNYRSCLMKNNKGLALYGNTLAFTIKETHEYLWLTYEIENLYEVRGVRRNEEIKICK